MASFKSRSLGRMSANPHANGGLLLKDLRLPEYQDYAIEVAKPGATTAESTRQMGKFLRDTMKLNMSRKPALRWT